MTERSVEQLRKHAKRLTQELADVAPQMLHTAQLYDTNRAHPQQYLTGRAQCLQQVAFAANTTIAYDMHGRGAHQRYVMQGFRDYDTRYETHMTERKVAFTRYTEPKVILKAICEPSLQDHDSLGHEESRNMQRAVTMVFMSFMSDNTLATVYTALTTVFDQITWNYSAWMDYSKTIQAVREWLLATLDTAIQDTVSEIDVPWEWRKPMLVEHFIELLDAKSLDHILQYHKTLQHTGMGDAHPINWSNISAL